MSSKIDKSIPPQSHLDGDINLLDVEKTVFPNKVELYSISAGIEEVIKIEFFFNAGSKFQNKALLANAVNNLLKNGTASKSQLEINEKIERFGAFLENTTTFDHASLSLYSLNKHLPQVLESVREMLFESVFPEDELMKYLRQQKQNHLVNQQKVSYLANQAFRKSLFGDQHPYGQTIDLEDFSKIEHGDLLSFHSKHYNLSNLRIFASGFVGDEQIQLIGKYFGNESADSSTIDYAGNRHASSMDRNILIEKEEAVQSAIKIGRLLFTKEHPDFIGMQLLSTVLGGYFGSRLMRNIREDKGYTYGIGSAMISLADEGYFVISTEVGVDVTKATLDEIYKEMEQLQKEKIEEKELELVKNYIFGKMMRSFDGPFNAMDKFIAVHTFGLDYSYYQKKVNEISAITSQHLLYLAKEYLKPELVLEVVAGKK